MGKDYLLIGVDGGATKVSGWSIDINTEENTFNLGEIHAERSYRDIPGYIADFKPIEVTTQLKERETGAINPTNDEKQQAAVYVEACAQVVEDIVSVNKQNSVLVGLGMPGLKTENKRGISALANGPRMIHYCDQLEKRLEIKDIQFLSRIDHIGSDADYCGIGENYSAEGLFKDIKNGYYLGGGTGVADAMKLNKKLVPFDETKEWIAKTWEMKSNDGRSLERFASAGGIQNIYAEHSKTDVSELNNKQIFPYQVAELAVRGEEAAIKTYQEVVKNISLLLYERISTLYGGWQSIFTFVNPNRSGLSDQHPYIGFLFDKIIIGQRLGDVFDSEAGLKFLKMPVMKELENHIQSSSILDARAKNHYSNLEGLLFTSKLREAPVIGAGIDAYLTFTQKGG